ncbi:MAG TPA: haloacid dehalogenase type II [Casimicrobiaceae bacterium]|nr:haloacid dehalogenase type II [Casimicrobiaceae bacterium]
MPDAFVFDAYGTLYDVHSVARLGEALAPGHGAALSQLWRVKQLEYTWQTSLMERRIDFREVTTRALDYALAALGLSLDATARQALVDAWLDLAPFPDARATLERLRPAPRWILSNGTLDMLRPLLERSGLASSVDGVLSVDAVGIYKPSPRVYELATSALGLPADRIGFVSANCWDAIGAKAFGFTVWWINRAGAPIDRHGPAPDHVVASLDEVR